MHRMLRPSYSVLNSCGAPAGNAYVREAAVSFKAATAMGASVHWARIDI